MNDQEETREAWEQEIKDVQHGVTFPEGLRQAQILSKRASATPAPIPDFGHFLRFLLSGAFLGIGFFVLLSDIPYRVPAGMATLIVGCGLGIAAFRWPRKD